MATKTRKELLKDIEDQVIKQSSSTSTVIEGENNNKEELKETKESLENKIDQEKEERKKMELRLENLPRIGPITIQKLRTIGIIDIWGLSSASARAVYDVIGSNTVTQQACTNFIVSAHMYLEEKGYLKKPIINSQFMLDNEVVRKRFSTGDKGLDNFFGGGGIEGRAMTEIYGKYQTGKTQICFCTAATTAQNDKRVLYIDTENTYYATRIQEICEEKGYDSKKVHKNIDIMPVNSASMLSKYVEEIRKYINENKYELIIVDSIIALHRAEFLGRGSLSDRQQELARIMGTLVKVAEAYDVAVLVTNQVLDSPDPLKPGSYATGGNIIAHTSTHRVYLKSYGKKEVTINGKKVKRDASKILMQDSPRYARTESLLTLGRDGVRVHDAAKLSNEEEEEYS